MVKTFNTCADLNIKYQKTLLQCTNNYRASINVGLGQVMMRVSIARVPETSPPDSPIAGNEWAIIVTRRGVAIETVKLKDLVNHKTVGVENMLTGDYDQVHYEAYITMIKTSDSSEQPTSKNHLRNWNSYNPIAIIFEVC